MLFRSSLITAGIGMEQGKPIFVVPGPISSSLSAGPNELLKLGAHAVTRVEDIFAVLGINQSLTGKPDSQFEYQPKNSFEKKILGIIDTGPRSVDELVRQTNFPVSKVSEILVELDLAGVVKQVGDEWKLL